MTVKSLTVDKVLIGSTAAKAGVKVDDQIIEIDGLSVEGCNINTLIHAMEKPSGENVTLIIKRRGGSNNKITVEVTARTSD
jgi:carboxyl-terminal processing protease